jgi:hypothetical protein
MAVHFDQVFALNVRKVGKENVLTSEALEEKLTDLSAHVDTSYA